MIVQAARRARRQNLLVVNPNPPDKEPAMNPPMNDLSVLICRCEQCCCEGAEQGCLCGI